MIPLGEGLHRDVPEDVYHRDPCEQASLSSSVARRILRSPMHAREEHPRLNPNFSRADEGNDRARDMGSAAHALMLGTGAEVALIPHANYKKDAAKAAALAAREAGRIPLLQPDHDAVTAMVDAGRKQLAGTEFSGLLNDGDPELTAVWREGDAWCRSRIDYLPSIVREGGHVIVPDYKTTAGSADPDDWERTLTEKNYAFQAAFYERGLRKLIPAISSVEFVFIVQEQDPPYALSLVGLEGEPRERAEREVEVAIRIWQHCIKTGEWPGYPRQLVRVGMNTWRGERSELRNASLLDRLARWQSPLNSNRGTTA